MHPLVGTPHGLAGTQQDKSQVPLWAKGFATSPPVAQHQPVTCPGSAGNLQHISLPPNSTQQHPTPPETSSTGFAATVTAQLAFYLCDLGDAGELAEPCQGDPFMQRLHFGPARGAERSRRWGASGQSRRLQPRSQPPLRWLRGNHALLSLLRLPSNHRLCLPSHLCSS